MTATNRFRIVLMFISALLWLALAYLVLGGEKPMDVTTNKWVSGVSEYALPGLFFVVASPTGQPDAADGSDSSLRFTILDTSTLEELQTEPASLKSQFRVPTGYIVSCELPTNTSVRPIIIDGWNIKLTVLQDIGDGWKVLRAERRTSKIAIASQYQTNGTTVIPLGYADDKWQSRVASHVTACIACGGVALVTSIVAIMTRRTKYVAASDNRAAGGIDLKACH